jgi:antitoxin component of MazEF toxin-antitoxin module
MDEKTYKIYESKGQLKVTVPAVLAQAVGLSKGDDITWLIDRGELVMKKAKVK